MMKTITAEMLPEECGRVIKVMYGIMFPQGKTVEELKASESSLLRKIGSYFEQEAEHGDHLL